MVGARPDIPSVWRESPPRPREHPIDKTEYDRPDDTKGSRAVVFLGLAVIVIGVFYFGYFA